MARALSPIQGGSAPRNPETTGKLQVLRNFSNPSVEEGKTNQSSKDNPLYVGLEMPTHRVDSEGKEKENKKDVNGMGKNREKKTKSRNIEDGLLMVVATRIYGKTVRALIDSGATRCFVTPAYAWP